MKYFTLKVATRGGLRADGKTEKCNKTDNAEITVIGNARMEILAMIMATAEGQIMIATLCTPPQASTDTREEYSELASCNTT